VDVSPAGRYQLCRSDAVTPVEKLESFLGVLDLEPCGDGRYRARGDFDTSAGVVFGGQIQAQMIVAAATVDQAKEVKSLHTVFARGADPTQPLEFDVDVLHAGRTFASATIAAVQRGQIKARALALLNDVDSDLIRHQTAPPNVDGPARAKPSDRGGDWWEVRTVGGVDIADPDTVGPAELFVWTRFPGAPSDSETGRALLAYAADAFLIGTAMRPHKGVGQSLAHVTISTTVLTQTLTFHAPVDASEWLLLALESPHSGGGRSYGRGHVFTGDGTLVASYTQENMIRDFPDGLRPAPGQRTKH
jgi:acyl-CoA thioesterase II